MKIVVFGANGFIGKAVANELSNAGHDILTGRDVATGVRVDLSDMKEIKNYVRKHQPEVIINCAGIVDESAGFDNNVLYTENIFYAVQEANCGVSKIIVTGSAGEYGVVESLPVPENAELSATSSYALSKVHEEQVALKLSESYGIQVVIVRVFNPLGPGMKNKFLVPGLMRQIRELNEGESDHIEISSLNSPRDYIDVRDIATAYCLLVEGKPKYKVYNIGSGVATKNSRILELILKMLDVKMKPTIIETAQTAEPQIASQADISRIQQEFGWKPLKTLEETIKDIANV